MDKARKTEIMKEFALKEGDTGSSEVQVALLTQRIKEMTEHLKQHRKDTHSRRGLQLMVEKRRKHLRYLYRTKHDVYLDLIKRLGLRR